MYRSHFPIQFSRFQLELSFAQSGYLQDRLTPLDGRRYVIYNLIIIISRLKQSPNQRNSWQLLHKSRRTRSLLTYLPWEFQRIGSGKFSSSVTGVETILPTLSLPHHLTIRKLILGLILPQL